MLDDILDFAHLSVWVVHFLYFVGLLPQIIVNYKLKSSRGLSDLMLSGYFVGYLFVNFYVFLLDLPLSYKVMVPLATIAVLVLVFQRFYYVCLDDSRKSFVKLFGIIFLLSLGVAFFVLKYAPYTGRVFGWLSAMVWTVYQIPQIIKIYMSKSTKGLSFAFVSIMGCAVSLEFFFFSHIKITVADYF